MQLCEEWLDVTASSSCVNWGRGAIPQAVSCVVGATNDPELERRLEDGVMDAVPYELTDHPTSHCDRLFQNQCGTSADPT